MAQITNWKKELSNAALDNKVGIKIANLTDDSEFAMHVTEIAPGSKVGAHYHNHGVEIYQILSGKGRIHLTDADNRNDIKVMEVQSGDFFTVKPKTVHQLINNGTEPLVLVFGCPNSHLSSDRVISDDLI